MATKERKLDLFALLNRINKKQAGIVPTLSEDEVKEVQPLLIERWLSGTDDARQVYFLNEVVNPYVFSLNKHKDLLIDLCTICTDGGSQRYSWIKAPGKLKSSSSMAVDVLREYMEYSEARVREVFSMVPNEDIISYAEQLGRSAEDMTKLKKELKAREA